MLIKAQVIQEMNPLKILFIYPSAQLPNERLKTYNTWEQLGAKLKVVFAYTENYQSKMYDRILHRLRIPRDPCDLNSRIKEACENFKPDLVFIVKGVLVKPKTLKYIKQLGMKSVSWSNDDMYAWHNRSLWYTWSLKYYDLVVTQKSYNCNPDELPSLGAKVLFQDKAIDPQINKPVEDCDTYDCVHDVVFVGTKEEDRLEHLIYLAEHGIEVHIYGWSQDDSGQYHDNLIFHNTHLYGDDFNAALGCSKIALNFLRKMNRDVQTSRSIEIPAAGGFMIAERTDEHQKLFKEGVEADYFSTKEELLEKVEYYLNNEKERQAIAKAGFERCYTSDYTFKNRMSEILEKVLDDY